MRILIVSTGSAGDVNPFIGLGRALVTRGHAVRLLVNPHFEQRARQAGIDVVPLGTERDFLDLLHRPDLLHPFHGNFVVWNALVKWAPVVLNAAERAIAAERPDLIIQHHIALGMSWVCARHGIPRVVGALAPSMFLSPTDWAGGGNSFLARVGRQLFRAVLDLLGKPLVYFGIERKLETVARDLGYPRPRPIVEHEWFRGDLMLGLWSPVLRPPLPDDPPRSHVTGFPWFDDGHGLSGEKAHSGGSDEWEAIERFLEQGEPPVIFTLGSTAVHSPGAKSFFDMASEACAILRRRAVLLVGNAARVLAPDEMPAGLAAFRYAPYSRILPRGCCSVIHGGIGSCGQAMRAGRPILVIPHAFDQFDNAKRLVRLGIADSIPRGRVSVGRLVDAIERLLATPSYQERSAQVERGMEDEDGATTAAKVIESHSWR